MGRAYHILMFDARMRSTCTVIGHRGACAYFPENTMASFRGALGLGADMIEFDIQLSRDGIPVVFHDERIDRCTDGSGTVAEHSLAELKQLDAGSWFAKRYEGERIPALEEVLGFCRGRIAVNIEIKTEAVTDELRGGIEEKALTLVREGGMYDHAVFSSFDPRALAHLRRIDPDVPLAILYDKKYFKNKMPSAIVEELRADCFNCSAREIGRAWMHDCLSHEIPVNVYTANSRVSMRRLIGLGVSGIFTNRPDVMKKVIYEHSADQ